MDNIERRMIRGKDPGKGSMGTVGAQRETTVSTEGCLCHRECV